VDTWRTITSYDYGVAGGAGYALGAVVSQTGVNSKLAAGSSSWTNQPGSLTSTSYVWWDGAVQDVVTHDGDTGSGSNLIFTTTYTKNGIGQVTSTAVQDGIPKTLAYTLDANGQIVRQMGMTGNNGTNDTGYVQSVQDRTKAAPDITSSNAGLFRNGTSTGSVGYADFSQSLEPYNSNSQGAAGGGTYSVRSGDTLQGIAAALYGDANLWYRLAEANGLGAQSSLTEGQSLILPAGVTKNTHSAATFQPYDASEALGDTLPTTPKPPKTPKCGLAGQLILVVGPLPM
jgi:LysM repeat protein